MPAYVMVTGKAPEQISLPFERDEKVLQDHFQQALEERISLTITDNSTSMISSSLKGGVISLRLHRMFLNADAAVLNEIAKFVRHRRCKTPLIRRYMRENSSLLKTSAPKVIKVRTEGRYHNLTAVFSSLNLAYFDGRVTARITWGTRKRGSAVRLRTLGSYSSHTHTIRINPVLDARSVPGCFLEFVVYHEMLHADMGTERKNGRRLVHSRAFRERERLFADYEMALAWERSWTGRDRP
jgi:SprT-like family